MSRLPILGTSADPRRLGAAIARRATPDPATLTQTSATVLSIQAGPPATLTVSLGADATPVPGVQFRGYTPTVNDVVRVDLLGRVPMVVGVTSSSVPIASGGTWSSLLSYAVGAIVQGSDSLFYLAVAASLNQDPTTTSGFWKAVGIAGVVAGSNVTVTGAAAKPTINASAPGSSTLAGDSDVSLTSPANADVLMYDSTLAKWKNAASSAGFNAETYMQPSAALYETIPRWAADWQSAMTSGQLVLVAIALPSNTTIGHIAFVGGSTGGTFTHLWFGLYDSSFSQLAVTADTPVNWGSPAGVKSLAIATVAAGAATSFTTTYTGRHYLGVMQAVSAGSTGALIGHDTAAQAQVGMTPLICLTSDAGQTTPPAFPHTATQGVPTGFSSLMYAYVAT